MPELDNSQRRIPKATYVPRTLPQAAQAASGRALEKAAFLRSLKIEDKDFAALSSNAAVARLTVPAKDSEPARPLLDLVKDFVAIPHAAALKKYGAALARTSMDDIVAFGEAVAKARASSVIQLKRALDRVASVNASANSNKSSPRHLNIGRALGDWKAASTSPTLRGTAAAASDVPPDSEIMAAFDSLQTTSDQTALAVEQFKYRSPLSPVGQIHLERLEMTPFSVEHGELVHSIPLAPLETVNIAHREWSQSSQSYETLARDALEGYSETGVTEKHDLARASEVETTHASSLDVSGSISATYNGGAYSLTASAAVAYGSKDESHQSEKSSIAHSMAVTRTASARTKKEHQISFKVASAVETEDLAVRTITNKSATEAMRVDYYQLLRKWRVDLIRYGLRMTYDLVVPNPGIDLVQRVMELQDLTATLLKGNVFTLDPLSISRKSWQTLGQQYGVALDPPPAELIEIMRTATVPGQTYDKWGAAIIQFTVPDGYKVDSGHFRGLFSLYNYESDGRHLNVRILGEPQGVTSTGTGEFEGADYIMDFDLTTGTVVGRTGEVFVNVEFHNIDYGDATIAIKASPTDALMQTWQAKVWGQLQEADQANFAARMALARDRKAQLEAEIAQFDALTLRKMEREEVMKTVIQWMLGPHFKLMPDDIQDTITASADDSGARSGTYPFPAVHDLLEDQWHAVLDHGELIKFLHNAIEWENVIFFAYPYFWDRYENFEFKRFLLHHDPTHREFLRAGCARVVLPVRPGFETSFAMLMETGDATKPPDTSFPYVSIGEEVRNFAMTNYEALPPANPDRNVRTQLYPIQRRAWREMQDIMKALKQYYTDNGSQYPDKLSDAKLTTAATKAGVKLELKDPFGAPYQYRMPGFYGEYDLWTPGDATQKVDGLEGAINSWAEGTVIGRWYEYTPTSALDIAVSKIKVDQTQLNSQPAPA